MRTLADVVLIRDGSLFDHLVKTGQIKVIGEPLALADKVRVMDMWRRPYGSAYVVGNADPEGRWPTVCYTERWPNNGPVIQHTETLYGPEN